MELALRYDLMDGQYPLEPDPAFRRRGAWILARLGQFLPQGGRVLDLGCGRGFYLPLYARLGLEAVGVEPDPIPRAEALHRAAATNAIVVAAQAEALPFADGSFDAVVLSEVLEHLPEPALALAEVARVLRGGGLLLVTVPHADYPFFWDPVNWLGEALGIGPKRKGIFSGIWANHERLYRPEDLREALQAAGFLPEAVEYQTRYCLPFLHNIIYDFGRRLLEKGAIPSKWLDAGLRGAPNTTSARGRLSPIAGVVKLIRLIDRLNQDRESAGPSQNLSVAARRGP